jgi:hypothetical protein
MTLLPHCCCRLSGTGSAGATIRMYIEQYTDDKARLKEDAQVALKDIIKVRIQTLICVLYDCVIRLCYMSGHRLLLLLSVELQL